MKEFKTKLEVLEEIIKSDNITACEKVCILSTALPEELKKKILIYTNGMVSMAELMKK